MSTTTSSTRNITQRLPTSNSINSMTTNGSDSKSNRHYMKKSLSATNPLQNGPPTNGFNNYVKKHAILSNSIPRNRFAKTDATNEKTTNGSHHHHHHHHHHHNGHSNQQLSCNVDHSPSPPIVYHAIAPAPSSEQVNNLTKETDDPQKSNDVLLSESSRRIANVLAHSRIKTMSNITSSCSDEEGESSLHRSEDQSSSLDTDADESDHELNKIPNTKQISKARRTQRTRNSSLTANNNNTSTPPISKTNIRKDDQQHQSSSNDGDDDDDTKEIKNVSDETNSYGKRLKSVSLKKRDHTMTTTTTDDDTSKHHRYHPLDVLERVDGNAFTSESTPSSLIPTNLTPVNQLQTRKANRFQVKSIRKSQQQQILLANAAAAKSSNDDDCSVSNQRTKLPLKPSLIERKHTNTPTTDGENFTTNTDIVVNGAVSALKTVENGSAGRHRVRFHVTQPKKPESAAEEEKLHAPTTPVSAPAPASSTASAQGEDEEEEETVAKSPDNRFIKYAKEIGRGAFKTVYRGLDTETSVAVAWCELQDFAQFDKHERARFKEEAEMLKKLQHQNIVRFYDFWEETNPRTNKKVIILVTELMTSGSLKGYIRNFKGQKEEKRINVMKKWCRQILKGLAYLHSRNPPVIHRDLKCDNVFISSTTGCVKIGDLGLATFKTQTFAKSMRGTMEFMAPEMFDEKYDELVDIYSFGLCMLEMITGEYPYIECKVPTAVIKRVTAGLKPDCYYKVESEDVREVIDCCIRTKKDERLSVQDLLQHSFFLDDNGLRVDLVRDSSNDSSFTIKNDTIDLKLKIVDKTKRKAVYPERKTSSNNFEAILFPYNLHTDTPEQIAGELIGKDYIVEDDKKFVIQSIRDRLRALTYEFIDRQAGIFPGQVKPVHNQSPQPSVIIQPPQQTAPFLSLLQAAAFGPVSAPVPSSVQQTPVDQHQHQQQQQQQQQQTTTVPSSDIPSVKHVVATEPTPVAQLHELSPNIPGSAGSFQSLEAALKKTFNKINTSQGAATTTSITVNDTDELPLSTVNPDDTLVSKPATNTTAVEQQQVEEPVLPITSEPTTNILQSSTPTNLQTQSQPTTMLTNQQQELLQTSHLLSQPPQSYSYSTLPSSQHIANNIIPIETTKQVTLSPPPPPPPPSSSASVTVETIENSHIPISPSTTPLSAPHTSEAVQPSVASDTQPPVSGSLQQLEVLLMKTFKKQNKTAGTAHSSDGEAANTNTPPIPSNASPNNDDKTEVESVLNDSPSITDDNHRKTVDRFNSTNSPSPQTFQMSQQLSESTHFDPLISPDSGNLQDLETLLKSTCQKSVSADDTFFAAPQISSTNDDTSDLKSMIMDLSRTLLNKMSIIETKIDDHCTQTRKINHMLTNTILPSLVDLTEIIQETSPSNLDVRVKNKLETIQTRIRSTQQQQQTEMRDLMDI